MHLLVATRDGVLVAERSGEEWRVDRVGLEGKAIACVAGTQELFLAGGREGVFRSRDGGASWEPASEGLSTRYVRWLCVGPPDASDPSAPWRALAGTEPAGIFVTHDGAQTWEERPEVAELRSRYGWSLPYSPEAGCIRGFAISGQRAYAAVEDGCVLVSNDAGETWRLAQGSRGPADHRPREGFIHSDVHSIEVFPSSPDLVFAPTGGGFFRSQDGGRRWESIYPHHYCRAVWVDPANPDHMVLGPADGVDYNGRIEVTRDGGRTWEPANTGLETPWHRHMVERFAQAGGELLAALSNGELFSASMDHLEWQQILPDIKGVNAVWAG